MAEIKLSDNDVCRLLGWMDAKRPEGDWDPPFLRRAFSALEHSIKREDSDDS